jgi:hypothetical protein
MIVISAALIGAVTGWITAARRNGNRMDKAQYAAGFGIAFALVGLVATVVVHRMAV